MIEIQDLYKYYGDRRVIGPLSAKIEQGQIVGLLGLNGAGKTTTLRILACDLLPTSGSVRVDGVDVVENPELVRAKIGYLPDTPPLYNEMRVSEYLGFAAKLRGVPNADVKRRVDDAIEQTELGGERYQLISALSHGFKQRVGIAQAIVHRPKLVVLDEPISGLDPKQIVEMRDLVRGLRGEHTVIVSSHILTEISETCDQLLVIRDGKIAAAGTEAELFSALTHGMRVEVTVRAEAAQAEATLDKLSQLARSIPGISDVNRIDPPEPGGHWVTALIVGERDVREDLLKVLVHGGLQVVQFARSENELENVFLSLSGAGERRARRGAQGAARGTTTAEAI
ncbi:MAG: ABC transporter ATP-binding protein [Polyangiaceae bacterium]|nr:ABC transporter ATP-binding protein [Polyangiaceae bacterium]